MLRRLASRRLGSNWNARWPLIGVETRPGRGQGGGGAVSKLKGASGSTRNTDSDEDLIDTGRCRSAKLCKVAAAAAGFRFGWDVVRDDPAPRN